MFSKPGFRGIKVLPYPAHIKDLIDSLSPEKKSKSKNAWLKFYQGHELLDSAERKNETEKKSNASPWRSSTKCLVDVGGKLSGRTSSGRNLFELAYQNFEHKQESDRNLLSMSGSGKNMIKDLRSSMKKLVMENLAIKK